MRRSTVVWLTIIMLFSMLLILNIVQGVQIRKADEKVDALEARVLKLQQQQKSQFTQPADRSEANMRQFIEYIQRQQKAMDQLQTDLEEYKVFYKSFFQDAQDGYMRSH